MPRNRRIFKKTFKKQTVEGILNKTIDLNTFSKDKNIAKPLIQRWMNEFIAKQAGMKPVTQSQSPLKVRAQEDKDKTIHDLKLTVANLYLELERVGGRKLISQSRSLSR